MLVAIGNRITPTKPHTLIISLTSLATAPFLEPNKNEATKIC